jgi:hypothetical protein
MNYIKILDINNNIKCHMIFTENVIDNTKQDQDNVFMNNKERVIESNQLKDNNNKNIANINEILIGGKDIFKFKNNELYEYLLMNNIITVDHINMIIDKKKYNKKYIDLYHNISSKSYNLVKFFLMVILYIIISYIYPAQIRSNIRIISSILISTIFVVLYNWLLLNKNLYFINISTLNKFNPYNNYNLFNIIFNILMYFVYILIPIIDINKNIILPANLYLNRSGFQKGNSILLLYDKYNDIVFPLVYNLKTKQILISIE